MLNVRDQRQICFYFNSGWDARPRTHMLKTSDKVAFSELNMKKNSNLLTSSTEEEEEEKNPKRHTRVCNLFGWPIVLSISRYHCNEIEKHDTRHANTTENKLFVNRCIHILSSVSH